jgi:predicted outer membrane lipoprotein
MRRYKIEGWFRYRLSPWASYFIMGGTIGTFFFKQVTDDRTGYILGLLLACALSAIALWVGWRDQRELKKKIEQAVAEELSRAQARRGARWDTN